MRRIWLVVVLVGLVACEEPLPDVSADERIQPRTAAEVAFATGLLNSLQAQSIAENREYCGYIGLDADGEFAATPALAGELDGCQPEEPPADFALLASYHTHGAYAPDYDSELPSIEDLRADIAERVDGYISSPGGRIWFNDAVNRVSIMLCGQGCVIADPAYRPDPDYPPLSRYDLEALEERHGG